MNAEKESTSEVLRTASTSSRSRQPCLRSWPAASTAACGDRSSQANRYSCGSASTVGTLYRRRILP